MHNQPFKRHGPEGNSSLKLSGTKQLFGQINEQLGQKVLKCLLLLHKLFLLKLVTLSVVIVKTQSYKL